jgi:hypothetical protein
VTPSSGCHAPASYVGAEVAVGTRHGKETAFAPAFARWLGASVRASTRLDTDALGTFTGDVPRSLSPRDAAVAKATGAAVELGTPFGVATEASYAASFGGFGPVVHEELAVFVDLDQDIQVAHAMRAYVRLAPPVDVADEAQARAYLDRVGFPAQAVVARTSEGMTKGLQNEATVLALARRGTVRLEPDLRAHKNPPRRRTLRRLAWALTRRLCTACPVCGCQGFGPVDVVRGLPCGACGLPTSRVRADVDGCASCGVRVERPRALTRADPATCDVCNP